MNLTLIAYRPDGGDYNHGVIGSDHEIHVCDSEDHLAERVAHYMLEDTKAKKEHRYASEWSGTILVDGIPINGDWVDHDAAEKHADLLKRVMDKAQSLYEGKLAAWQDAEAEKARKQNEEAAERQRQRDLEEHRRLSAKLGLPPQS